MFSISTVAFATDIVFLWNELFWKTVMVKLSTDKMCSYGVLLPAQVLVCIEYQYLFFQYTLYFSLTSRNVLKKPTKDCINTVLLPAVRSMRAVCLIEAVWKFMPVSSWVWVHHSSSEASHSWLWHCLLMSVWLLAIWSQSLCVCVCVVGGWCEVQEMLNVCLATLSLWRN